MDVSSLACSLPFALSAPTKTNIYCTCLLTHLTKLLDQINFPDFLYCSRQHIDRVELVLVIQSGVHIFYDTRVKFLTSHLALSWPVTKQYFLTYI